MLMSAISCAASGTSLQQRIACAKAASPLSRRVVVCIDAAVHGTCCISALAGRRRSISRPRVLVTTAAAGSTGGAAGKSSKVDRRRGRSSGKPSSSSVDHTRDRAADSDNNRPAAGTAQTRRQATGHFQRPPKQSKPGRNACIINDELKACTTVAQLQQLVQRDGPALNYVNLATAIVTLQRILSKSALRQQQQVVQTADSFFIQLWRLQQPKLPQCKARQVANMIYSASLLPTPLQQRFQWVVSQHLLPAFVRQVSTAHPQHVSNVLYGTAASGQQLSQESINLLISQLVAVLPTANTQEIANTLWAVAKMQQQIQPTQLQQLLDAFCAVAQNATPQEIANALWAVATMQQQIQTMQLQQLLDAFCAVAQTAKPQAIKDTLWAVATMQQQIQTMQLQQLLDAFCAVAQTAKPQAIKDTLWAVATMQQQVQPTQLQQLLVAFCAVAKKATPQGIANTLWAVATMKQQVEQGQLEQMLSALVMQLNEAVAQNVSNTLWACAELRYLPKQLLTAPDLIDKLATATPQELANTAWACAQLGYRDEQLMSALLKRVLDLVGTSKKHLIGNGVVAQNVTNLCWSLAVLDLREHAPTVLTLVQAAKPLWASMVPENLSQLYQVHLWLTDHTLTGGKGLAAVSTAQQLEQCQSTWQQLLGRTAASESGPLHQSVYDALQRIPVKWLVPPAMEQASLGADGQPDGAALIDITARTADEVWLAVEVDGPTHYRQPDWGLMGPTLYRNRALAVRGYVLISVPYYEWNKQHSGKLKQQYLLEKITAALQQAAAGKNRQ